MGSVKKPSIHYLVSTTQGKTRRAIKYQTLIHYRKQRGKSPGSRPMSGLASPKHGKMTLLMPDPARRHQVPLHLSRHMCGTRQSSSVPSEQAFVSVSGNLSCRCDFVPRKLANARDSRSQGPLARCCVQKLGQRSPLIRCYWAAMTCVESRPRHQNAGEASARAHRTLIFRLLYMCAWCFSFFTLRCGSSTRKPTPATKRLAENISFVHHYRTRLDTDINVNINTELRPRKHFSIVVIP
ncbi:LADA_0D13080g1_1 [Lachancea dasiensis]|uniref:LADA_0D13080g1_1 n=1 Tax=Lachancea dasiensis TaxID=1072105 RepID=A0A1G4J8G6_9SACH|nr:LADA_0D13080g1_1 [Lachancea dasiensis]